MLKPEMPFQLLSETDYPRLQISILGDESVLYNPSREFTGRDGVFRVDSFDNSAFSDLWIVLDCSIGGVFKWVWKETGELYDKLVLSVRGLCFACKSRFSGMRPHVGRNVSFYGKVLSGRFVCGMTERLNL